MLSYDFFPCFWISILKWSFSWNSFWILFWNWGWILFWNSFWILFWNSFWILFWNSFWSFWSFWSFYSFFSSKPSSHYCAAYRTFSSYLVIFPTLKRAYLPLIDLTFTIYQSSLASCHRAISGLLRPSIY